MSDRILFFFILDPPGIITETLFYENHSIILADPCMGEPFGT